MNHIDKKLDLILEKLESIESRLKNLEDNLGGHIDEVMGIYNYHRQPLDFITNTFNSYIIPQSKELDKLSNKKTEQLTHQQSKDS